MTISREAVYFSLSRRNYILLLIISSYISLLTLDYVFLLPRALFLKNFITQSIVQTWKYWNSLFQYVYVTLYYICNFYCQLFSQFINDLESSTNLNHSPKFWECVSKFVYFIYIFFLFLSLSQRRHFYHLVLSLQSK